MKSRIQIKSWKLSRWKFIVLQYNAIFISKLFITEFHTTLSDFFDFVIWHVKFV